MRRSCQPCLLCSLLVLELVRIDGTGRGEGKRSTYVESIGRHLGRRGVQRQLVLSLVLNVERETCC